MSHEIDDRVAVDEPGPAAPAGKRPVRLRWLAGFALLAAVAGTALYVGVKASAGGHAPPPAGPEPQVSGLPVNTVLPATRTLVRTLEQPGTIRALAQSELHAKASGYVKLIQREAAGGKSSPAGAPQKDIGSLVRAGEVLIQLDVPELVQDVAQKQALVQQSEAELRQARTGIGTFEAAVTAAQAHKKQVESEVRRYASEHEFQRLQLKRTEELLRDRIGTQEVVDEKRNQVNAALAAWESAQAKAQAAQADLAVVSSKLAAARDDVLVKEARLRVAREDLRRAEILADYANIRAPFDGVITFRGVDEGDFVQNSSSGQARHVMTVAAIDRVKVVLQVPEREAPWVRVGAEAAVRMDARGGWSARGTVARTSRSLDSQSRTMQVEIDLDNPGRQLLPGMYGQVVVTLQSIANARAVPASAVFSRRGENFVLAVRDGVAHRQRVRIRYDDGKELEVIKLIDGQEVPLDGTEELIVSNKGEIADGQRVHATRLGSGGASARWLAAP